MALRDAIDDRQTKPGTIRLSSCGVEPREGLLHASDRFSGDAHAAIGDFDTRRLIARADRQMDRVGARCLTVAPRILRAVQHDALDLGRVPADRVGSLPAVLDPEAGAGGGVGFRVRPAPGACWRAGGPMRCSQR